MIYTIVNFELLGFRYGMISREEEGKTKTTASKC